MLNVSVDTDDRTTVDLPRYKKVSGLTVPNAADCLPKYPMLARPLLSFDKLDRHLRQEGYENFIMELKYDGERMLSFINSEISVFYTV